MNGNENFSVMSFLFQILRKMTYGSKFAILQFLFETFFIVMIWLPVPPPDPSLNCNWESSKRQKMNFSFEFIALSGKKSDYWAHLYIINIYQYFTTKCHVLSQLAHNWYILSLRAVLDWHYQSQKSVKE